MPINGSKFCHEHQNWDTQIVAAKEVKWVGYPESQSTWQPEANVPSFIRKYYEDENNKLPAPTIEHSKTVAGVE